MLLSLLLVPLVSAADDDAPPWDVEAAHGPTHEVPIDVEEGTWMSVAVHGERVVFDLLGDLWEVPLTGGEATRLTEGPAWDVQPSFSPDGQELVFTSDRGGNENVWRMPSAGGAPVAVTDDAVARSTHGLVDPTDPDWLIVRRRTVDTRSIGVTELWQVHRAGGQGVQLTDKGAHPHAGEPAVHGPHVYFSSRAGRFAYGADAHDGLWRIERLDRRDGTMRTVASGSGSASHPMVHPDGERLVFVTRHATASHLVAMDLATGRRTTLWEGLSPDGMEGFALHGTYPRMDWTDDGRLVLWAQGKLWILDTTTGARENLPFHVQGTWVQHDVARPIRTVDDRVVARVIRQPAEAPDGRLAYSALGQLWVQGVDGVAERVGDGPGFAPAWHPDGETLAWASYRDATGGALHLTDAKGRTETLPVRGQLLHPSWSADGRQLVALRGAGGTNAPDPVDEPWYEVVLLTAPLKKRDPWAVQTVTTLDNRGPRAPRPRLHEGRVWFFEDVHAEPRTPPTSQLVSVDPDGGDRRVHLTLPGVDEVALSPDGRHVAYKHHHQVHLVPLPAWGGAPVAHDVLPGVQVTRIVGDWLGWSPDGRALTWMEGPEWHRLEVAGLLGADDPRSGLDDLPGVTSRSVRLALPRARPSSRLFLDTCDRVLTMGPEGVLEGASVAIEADRITAVGVDLAPPEGAAVIDCRGHTALPGLVDVHAHMHFSQGDALAEQPWRYQVALDYGVTTVHDPSAFTDEVFTQAERVAVGLAEGPRILSTGSVLYGALSNDGARTPDPDAARGHVQRLKAVGAGSVKVYQQSQRSRRQWYAQACREEQVICVPEGGGDLWMDLTMVADGYHAVEHSLPVTPLHADVIGFLRGSTVGGDGLGTFYTPTLQVAFGGLPAKHFFEQTDPFDDPLLRRHTPEGVLLRQLWRRDVWAREADARYRKTAADAARARAAGVHVTLGAHGELQGLGVHWELWALGSEGAMAPLQALEAATVEGARYLGLDGELGALVPGHLADVLVVEGDPTVDLGASTAVRHVVKNGRWVRGAERDAD